MSGFVHYITQELLGDAPGVTSRAMFGGHSLYKEGVIFGMIIGDRLYFKVDETNQAEYEARGSKPFHYQHKSKDIMMPYWKVSEEIIENKPELLRLLAQSVTVALNKKAQKKK